jgi:tetratricopeptide (TPR) repeat protein
MQPHAPFGKYVPFFASSRGEATRPIPADSRLTGGTLAEEATVVAKARSGLRLFDEERYGEAAAIWDELAEAETGVLNPYILAFARAQARWLDGKIEEAYALLEPVEAEAAPFGTRAWGLAVRGLLADRLGRREEALRLYERAQVHVNSRPEYNIFDDLREQIRAGLEAPRTDEPLPKLYWFLAVPR